MRKRPFGRTAVGRAVEQVVLESAEAAVSILSLGAIVRDWRIDGPAGSLPMVLGFPTVEAYERHARSHGAVCGRLLWQRHEVAGRRLVFHARPTSCSIPGRIRGWANNRRACIVCT